MNTLKHYIQSYQSNIENEQDNIAISNVRIEMMKEFVSILEEIQGE